MRIPASVALGALLAIGCGSSDDAKGGPTGECAFHDPASKLCWQEPPPEKTFTWQDAKSYCSQQGLRLPNIQELITLIRGCGSSACVVKDPGCLSTTCSSDPTCKACADLAGPGMGGCYWDPSLTGTCNWYWSASGVDEGPYDAWFVYFQSASAQNGAQAIEKYVRCVKSE